MREYSLRQRKGTLLVTAGVLPPEQVKPAQGQGAAAPRSGPHVLAGGGERSHARSLRERSAEVWGHPFARSRQLSRRPHPSPPPQGAVPRRRR